MDDSVPHIVTDSTADIPTDLARHLDITVIPCQIHIAGETYREGIDITRPEFYRRLRNHESFTTSQPPVGVFAQTYREQLADGRPVVAVHLAGGLSGLLSTAVVAAREVDAERITVVDSRQVSMCTGFLAVRAAEAARAGATRSQVLELLGTLLPRLHLLALIDDLRCLSRSGRVSWAAGLLGNLLAVKPIVQVQDGRVELAAKARTLARGMELMVAMAAEHGPLERAAVLHADAPAAAARLAEIAAGIAPQAETPVVEAGTVVSTHAGPGAVGIACLSAG